MTTLTISNTLTAGTAEDGGDVQENFTAITAWANGNIDDTNIATTSESATGYAVERYIVSGLENITQAGLASSDRYALFPSYVSTLFRGPAVFRIDPSYYAVTGRTTSLRLRGTLTTNNVAPAVNVSVQLYEATAPGGGGAFIPDITLGSAVGSAITFSSPSASAITSAQSASFTCPSAGYFALIFTVSGSQAAGSYIRVNAGLSFSQS